MPSVLLFDLDDTLYEERDYVLSGFDAATRHLADLLPTVSSKALRDAMAEELERNARGRIFDRVMDRFGLTPEADTVAAVVECYRTHFPKIELYPGVANLLSRLTTRYELAIVTDGLSVMQRNKVAALRLEKWVKFVVYCSDIHAPKPHPAGYHAALQLCNAKVEQAIVIGNNPNLDMAAAKAIGARSIRVRTGRFANEPSNFSFKPTREIANLSKLEDALTFLTN
jgi:putative hydrolase of the HAD superfamily